ncbi:hypothetical protein T439DRAFT_110093 [Meredithblackwellia eburnea MCA 4105]
MSGYDVAPKRRRVDQDYHTYVAPSTARTKAAANGRAEAARTAAAQLAKKDEQRETPLLDLATLPPASLQRYLSRYGLLEAHGSLSYHHAVFPVPPLPATLIPPLLASSSSGAGGASGPGSSRGRSRPAHTLRYKESDEEGGRRSASVVPQPHQQPPQHADAAGGGSRAGSQPNSGAPTPRMASAVAPAQGGGALTPALIADISAAPAPATGGGSVDHSSSASSSSNVGGHSSSTLPGAAGFMTTRKRVWQDPKTPEFADLTAYDDPQLVVDRLAARAKAHWDKKDTIKEGETLTNFIFALRMRAHTLRATPPG